jgi:Na+-driven multidrug efflux pump
VLALHALLVVVLLAPMPTVLKLGALASVNSFCSIAAVTVITAFIAHPGVDVLALCQYFESLGTGRMLWPVIPSAMRVVVIFIGCVVLARSPGARPEHFVWLIAADMAVQAIVVGAAIRRGASTPSTRRR